MAFEAIFSQHPSSFRLMMVDKGKRERERSCQTLQDRNLSADISDIVRNFFDAIPEENLGMQLIRPSFQSFCGNVMTDFQCHYPDSF